MPRENRRILLLMTLSISIVAFATLVGAGTSWHKSWRFLKKQWFTQGAQLLNNTLEEIKPMTQPTADLQTLRVWAIGDSITEGLSGYPSYRYWLWKKFERATLKVDFVGTLHGNFDGMNLEFDFDQDHNSYTGYRADQVLPLIAVAARKVEVDVALIHLGTNDVWQDLPADGIGVSIKQLIAILRKRNPKISILLGTIIPLAGFESSCQNFNRSLVEIATEVTTIESPIVIVDHFDGFDLEKHTYDGAHPNHSGEQLMAENWLQALAYMQDLSISDRKDNKLPANSSIISGR